MTNTQTLPAVDREPMADDARTKAALAAYQAAVAKCQTWRHAVRAALAAADAVDMAKKVDGLAERGT